MHTLTIATCACGRRGTLYDGRCGWCNGEAPRPALRPVAQPMTVAGAIAALVAELAEEIPQPLAQRLTLASVAADLCRLAGEPVPAAVLAALDSPAHAPTPRYRVRELEPA